jgi:hypothetical protein
MATFTCDSIPKRLTTTAYQIAIITDMGWTGTAGGGYDWDDQLNLAMALCTQDKFQLRFLSTDNSSSMFNAPNAAITEVFTAYAADLLTGTLPAESLSVRQLNDLTFSGAVTTTTTTPAAGYRVDGDSDYWRCHGAAQAFIKMARDCGDPRGTFMTNPYGKIWVAINGGYGTFAQILREAITGGALPDILDRCVFADSLGYNAHWTETSFAYWCDNCYSVDASTPGIFGATQMISFMPLISAIFDNNDAGQQALWDTMKTQGAMGAFLETARLASTAGSQDVPRACESVMMQFWLLEAERIGSWDPTNTSNLCGAGLQLYDNNNWPYAHGGAGLWTTGDHPTAETNFSPYHWGPRSTLTSQAHMIAAMDMTGYRTWMGNNFARYA